MIAAVVNGGREAIIRLPVRGFDRRQHVVEAIIDTGFTGFLTLPTSLIDELRLPGIARMGALLASGREVLLDLYEVAIEWDGRWLTVLLVAAVWGLTDDAEVQRRIGWPNP